MYIYFVVLDLCFAARSKKKKIVIKMHLVPKEPLKSETSNTISFLHYKYLVLFHLRSPGSALRCPI